MILRVIKILFVIPFMTKATEREQQRGILSLKRTFLPLLFGILCKQKEFRGSVYQDIYLALRLL